MAKRRETQTSVTIWLDPEQVEILDGLKGPDLSRSGYVTQLVAHQIKEIHTANSAGVFSPAPSHTTFNSKEEQKDTKFTVGTPPPGRRSPALPSLPARPSAFGAHGHRETVYSPPPQQTSLNMSSYGSTNASHNHFKMPFSDQNQKTPSPANLDQPDVSSPQPSLQRDEETGLPPSYTQEMDAPIADTIDPQSIKDAILRIRNRPDQTRFRRPPLSVNQLVDAVLQKWQGWSFDDLSKSYNVQSHIVEREILKVEEEISNTLNNDMWLRRKASGLKR